MSSDRGSRLTRNGTIGTRRNHGRIRMQNAAKGIQASLPDRAIQGTGVHQNDELRRILRFSHSIIMVRAMWPKAK